MEQIKAPIFLEALLAIERIYEPQSNLEEKDNPSILPIFTSIAPVKRNNLSYSNIEINTAHPAPVHSGSQVRFKIRSQLSNTCQI